MIGSRNQYELLDFGDGRKLERFGPVVLDRPCPSVAHLPKAMPKLWKEATARYAGQRMNDVEFHRGWTTRLEYWVPADWYFEHECPGFAIRLGLGALPSGQVGVFPEQRDNWDWIAGQCAKLPAITGGPLRVLNLFAYTGGSTLAAAAAGAEVTHVDAARNIVQRARQNAALSGLAERPIRWITEDAATFCQREVKRGNRYDAVILDPPSYGHGPKGQAWKIGDDLLPLLKMSGELTAENRAFVLVSCHSPSIGPAELSAYLADGMFGHCGEPPTAGGLFLETSGGRRLDSGVCARWPM